MKITIDGPAGAGKSTVARALAERLGFAYLGTGLLYRAVAYYVLRYGVSPEKIPWDSLVINVDLSSSRVYLDGRDITPYLTDDNLSKILPAVASVKSVREKLNQIQRRIVEGALSAGEKGMVRGIVIEGRDSGSYVFPDAEVKIYLDASIEERARRRYMELLGKGVETSYEEVLKSIIERDRKDTTREEAPLVIPEGAVYIDTTGMAVEDVLRRVEDEVRRFIAGKNR